MNALRSMTTGAVRLRTSLEANAVSQAVRSGCAGNAQQVVATFLFG